MLGRHMTWLDFNSSLWIMSLNLIKYNFFNFNTAIIKKNIIIFHIKGGFICGAISSFCRHACQVNFKIWYYEIKIFVHFNSTSKLYYYLKLQALINFKIFLNDYQKMICFLTIITAYFLISENVSLSEILN